MNIGKQIIYMIWLEIVGNGPEGHMVSETVFTEVDSSVIGGSFNPASSCSYSGTENSNCIDVRFSSHFNNKVDGESINLSVINN